MSAFASGRAGRKADKKVYDRVTSRTSFMSGSSRKSRSMKKKMGRSTSSCARIRCSSKQKHSTLAKYGAICGSRHRSARCMPEISEAPSRARALDEGRTLFGVTL